jgi:hypothetical protein
MQKFCAWHVAQFAETAAGPDADEPLAAFP